ncbi:LPXTG-site transpeptidase (sortase) family protein [Micromonospora pisi]|uniref:LPXTG-site transpeptidase (Sortase) family protein n=1 Tax=Micromonospora pisi TaxID=589240 RepID=A0A495JLB7_9ACTN|nr:sortase [Micromonospora pisi]RKR89703.1 LPXTG-site transpeptidase (sortase) family protein [Micromonospora pisi]
MTTSTEPRESGAARPAPPRTERIGLYLPGTALTILAVILLGFVAHVVLLSQVRYARAQQLAYADFRADLAEATAPVGQTDDQGRLLRPGTSVAVLRIPALGERQVVVEGTEAGVLMAGPGHRRDTVLPGQAGTSVIMGRQATYGGPFGRIALLSPGDQLTVTTGQGVHTYVVRGVRRPGDPAPPALTPGAGRLTLLTVAGRPFMPRELVRVDADLTSPAQPIPKRVLGRGEAALLPAERALASDQGAWIGLVLLTQALLAAVIGIAWARVRWGVPQAWVVGFPVVGGLGMVTADQIMRLLPNLL